VFLHAEGNRNIFLGSLGVDQTLLFERKLLSGSKRKKRKGPSVNIKKEGSQEILGQ